MSSGILSLTKETMMNESVSNHTIIVGAVAMLIGSTIIGYSHGWATGVGVFLLTYSTTMITRANIECCIRQVVRSRMQ